MSALTPSISLVDFNTALNQRAIVKNYAPWTDILFGENKKVQAGTELSFKEISYDINDPTAYAKQFGTNTTEVPLANWVAKTFEYKPQFFRLVLDMPEYTGHMPDVNILCDTLIYKFNLRLNQTQFQTLQAGAFDLGSYPIAITDKNIAFDFLQNAVRKFQNQNPGLPANEIIVVLPQKLKTIMVDISAGLLTDLQLYADNLGVTLVTPEAGTVADEDPDTTSDTVLFIFKPQVIKHYCMLPQVSRVYVNPISGSSNPVLEYSDIGIQKVKEYSVSKFTISYVA